ALICADGHAADFEYKGAEHVAHGLETIGEVRPGIAWVFFAARTRREESLTPWSQKVAAILKTHGGGPKRLAVDKCETPGTDALRTLGVTIVEGQELTEHARSIKSTEELELMRWTVRVCEAGMARIYEHSLPGKTEQEI